MSAVRSRPNKMRYLCLYLSLFSALLLTPVFADASLNEPLDASRNHDVTGLYTFFMVEDEDEISLQQAVQSYRRDAFRPVGKPVAGFGLNPHGVWLRIEVVNPTDRTLHRRLTVETPWLSRVDFYRLQNEQLLAEYQTGIARPLSSRQSDHRLFVFEQDYAPGNSTIYLRLQTHEPMILPVSFSDPVHAEKRDTLSAYGYGMLYGIISGLMLFNLMLYFSIRQQRYLYYVLYLAMYLYNNISFTGHGYFYLWQDASVFQQWTDSLSITLYATAGVLFALSFLHTREAFPRLYRYTLTGVALICTLQLLFIIGGMHMASVKTGMLYLMLFSLLTFGYAILSYRKGYKDAAYYMAASIATLVAAAITPLSVLDIIPFSTFTFHAGEIAVAFDSILLSIALASQIRHAQYEKRQAQKLARTDILTRLNNRLAFDEISKQIWIETKQNDSDLCFIMLDIDHFKEINDRYGHSAGDAVLKNVSSMLTKIVREDDVLVRWGGEEFAILLPGSSMQQAIKLAARIRKAIENLGIKAEGHLIETTVSLGVACREHETRSMDELFATADERLYRAKQEGRNRVCAGEAANRP